MTTRKNAEIELIKEQLKKLIYAQEKTSNDIRAMQACVRTQFETVLKQLYDTHSALNYVKTYIGIDDFFDEVKRQGKHSETGRIE